MHPADCPAFDYSKHPDRARLLPEATRTALKAIRGGTRHQLAAAAQDTRPIHKSLFTGLTPPGYEYFAGHYRGELYRCLEYYLVRIPSDPRVGCAPDAVAG